MIVSKKELNETIDNLRLEARHASDYHITKRLELESKNSNLELRLDILESNHLDLGIEHSIAKEALEARLDGLELLVQQMLTCFNVTKIPALKEEVISGGDCYLAYQKIDDALDENRQVEIKLGAVPERTVVELKKKNK